MNFKQLSKQKYNKRQLAEITNVNMYDKDFGRKVYKILLDWGYHTSTFLLTKEVLSVVDCPNTFLKKCAEFFKRQEPQLLPFCKNNRYDALALYFYFTLNNEDNFNLLSYEKKIYKITRALGIKMTYNLIPEKDLEAAQMIIHDPFAHPIPMRKLSIGGAVQIPSASFSEQIEDKASYTFLFYPYKLNNKRITRDWEYLFDICAEFCATSSFPKNPRALSKGEQIYVGHNYARAKNILETWGYKVNFTGEDNSCLIITKVPETIEEQVNEIYKRKFFNCEIEGASKLVLSFYLYLLYSDRNFREAAHDKQKKKIYKLTGLDNFYIPYFYLLASDTITYNTEKNHFSFNIKALDEDYLKLFKFAEIVSQNENNPNYYINKLTQEEEVIDE